MAKINCVLNARFLAARETPHFEEKKIKKRQNHWDGSYWYNESTWLVNKKTQEQVLCVSSYDEPDHCTQCCGIDELDFRDFGRIIDDEENPIYKHDYFDELVAKMVDMQCSHKDQRVLFVGLPTSIGEYSDYSIVVYEKIRKILKSFGFIELCPEPYKNNNSGNFITVLAGQMPE